MSSGESGRDGGPARRLAFARPPTRDAVAREIEHHVEELADRLINEGIPRADAETEARQRMGDLNALRRELEELTEGTERRWTMRTWIDEASEALRFVVRRPGVPVGAGLMLTAAMSVALTTWTVVDGVLYRPPPFPEPEQVMRVMAQLPNGFGVPHMPVEQAKAWAATDLWSRVGFTRRISAVRTDRGRPEEVTVQAMTTGALAALGVQPADGRLFNDDDALEGAPPVALVPETTAATLRDAGPVVGSTVTLDDQQVRVVGVLAEGVRYPLAFGSDVFVPMDVEGTALGRPGSRVEIVGRIGRDLDGARSRAEALEAGFREADPGAVGISLQPIGEHRVNSDIRRAMLLVVGAVAFLYLVALVNGGLLFVIQAASRADEEGVRLSLGASRGRLLRAWLIRAAALTTVGVVIAWGVATAITGPVLRSLPRDISYMVPDGLGPDGRLLLLAACLAGLALLALTLLPAFPLYRIGPAGASGAVLGARRTDGRGAVRLRNGLVAVQVALSLMLLSAAAVLARSHHALASADFGFAAERLAFISFTLPSERYPDPASVWAAAETLRERVAGLPGVTRAALADGAPARTTFSFGIEFQAEGRDPLPADPNLLLPQLSVDLHGIETLGLELIAGRAFAPADDGTARVLIDEPLARALWSHESAVGRRFRLGEDSEWLEVVGVVRDVRLFGPDDSDTPYDVIHLASRAARPWSTFVLASTDGDPRDLLPLMREAAEELDARVPPTLDTARGVLAEAVYLERFMAWLLLSLAAAAVVMAVLGLYGTVTYSVVRRVRELGIRAALGADAWRIRRAVLARGMGTVATGMAVGLVAALASLRLLDVVVYGVPAVDPLALIAAVSVLLVAGVVACIVPAGRAARTDPATVLRDG